MNGKEAIQILKNMNIEISGTSTCKECIYDDKTHCFRDGKDCQMQAIETVLNLLEKKNEEIEKYKTLLAQSTAKRVITSLKDSEKSKEDLKMLNDGWRIECEKKDKIIDELEDIFYNYQLCEYELTDCTYRKCEYIADDEIPPCKDCIKQYYEKKVEGK